MIGKEVLILIELLKNKNIKQEEIGKKYGITQQAVSYIIKKLREKGFLDKEGVSEKGKEFLLKFHKELSNVLFGEKIVIKGKVFSGLGEGKKFLGLEEYKKRIKEKLGFVPYEGTLNIKLDEENVKKRAFLTSLDFEYIPGFEKDGREYGGIFVKKCFIDGLEGAIIIPVKSRYGYEVLEVISPYYLRGKLGLKDGDEVSILL